MSHEWMIDVLADLRQFANDNYYLGLAEQLDDAIVVATSEVGRMESIHRLPPPKRSVVIAAR